jgi:hypothetical protein
MTDEPQVPVYHIYLLTAWREYRQLNQEVFDWRFSLIDPHTGQQYGFVKAEALLALVEELGKQSFSSQEDTS